jgi:hypothetical protein
MKTTFALVGAFSLLLSSAAMANPAPADKAKAAAFHKHAEQAEHKARQHLEAAHKAKHAYIADEVAAKHELREARIFQIRALELEGATAERIAAWEARRQAHALLVEEHIKALEAHAANLRAAHHEHDAKALTAAAKVVQNANLQKMLTDDAARETAAAGKAKEQATKLAAEAAKLKTDAQAKIAAAKKDADAAKGLEQAAQPPAPPAAPAMPASAATTASN